MEGLGVKFSFFSKYATGQFLQGHEAEAVDSGELMTLEGKLACCVPF